MSPITCIFFGRSGAGKGTQADLLLKLLADTDSKNKAIYVETGARFRTFIKESASHTAKKVSDTIGAGGLMPAFFPIWMWSGLLIDELKTGNEHLVLDGVCRRHEEPPILDSAFRFYDRKKPVVILLEVHHEAAKHRLLKRGRHDDKEEKIAERMRWYEADVVKAMHFFEKDPYYYFVRINGDQSIEDVHKDVCKVLGL